MKILIHTRYFYPSFGGIETVVSILAHEFVKQGHQVKLISEIPCDKPLNFPFEVYCNPASQTFLKLVKWCDFYFLNSLHYGGIWPLVIFPKPTAVTHHSWSAYGLVNQVKLALTRFFFNISISKFMAARIPVKSYLIPNPYRSDMFRVLPQIKRTKDLVFLGRLAPEKGINVLIEALALLKQHKSLVPSLTIIGSGPMEANLRELTEKLNLTGQIQFVGKKMNEELVEILNQHQIMVAPTQNPEPFGVVALEGIACGCVVVGTSTGGLKEAIGPCGLTFPNGEADKLADILFELLTDESKLDKYRKPAYRHLQLHSQETIGRMYLELFQKLINKEKMDSKMILPLEETYQK